MSEHYTCLKKEHKLEEEIQSLRAQLEAHQKVNAAFEKGAEGVNKLTREILDQRTQLAERDAQICAMKEKLNEALDSNHRGHQIQADIFIRDALSVSNSGPCKHEAEIEKLKKALQDTALPTSW